MICLSVCGKSHHFQGIVLFLSGLPKISNTGDVPIFNPGVFSRVVQRMLPSDIPSPLVRS